MHLNENYILKLMMLHAESQLENVRLELGSYVLVHYKYYVRLDYITCQINCVGLLHLNSMHLLWKIYHESSTGGVYFSNGAACLAMLFEIHTPSVQHMG